VASQKEVTVRALGFITAGHQIHHRLILEEQYFPAIPRAWIGETPWSGGPARGVNQKGLPRAVRGFAEAAARHDGQTRRP